jgi:hypothetical protein
MTSISDISLEKITGDCEKYFPGLEIDFPKRDPKGNSAENPGSRAYNLL